VSWRPILEGDDARRARERIAAIVATPIELDDPSLMQGWAGIALLHGYLARTGDRDAADRAHDALARAIEGLGTGTPTPWLGTGFVGVAWAMHHLRDLVDVDGDTLAAVDAMVADLLVRDVWTLDYELLAGLVGLGVYALERGLPALVERVVQHLDGLAVQTPRGITWWNHEYHNLGMAHGVTGVAALLAESSSPRARTLLDGAITWLSSHERATGRPRFPMCELLEVPPENLRNGWCYGDLPVACVLVRAGDAARGVALARAMARGPLADVTDFDAAFCHGAAGRAHLFNRLAQSTGDSELLDAARRYVRETLDRLDAASVTKPGLQSGSTGIALALLAAVSAVEPGWDRSLGVALPPRHSQPAVG
jgi:lantibiotic modifying enzyme